MAAPPRRSSRLAAAASEEANSVSSHLSGFESAEATRPTRGRPSADQLGTRVGIGPPVPAFSQAPFIGGSASTLGATANASNTADQVLRASTAAQDVPPTVPYSFQREDDVLDIDDFELAYTSAAEAEVAERPRLDPPSSIYDVDSFKSNEQDHVKRIMVAINSHTCTGPPAPNTGKPAWTQEQLAGFHQWHSRAQLGTREILQDEDGLIRLEARAWSLYEMIVYVHERGVREDLAYGDKLKTCSDRLDRIIKQLEDYPNVRRAALEGGDEDKFVSNPDHFAQEKVQWRRTNTNRAKNPKPKKREAVEMNDDADGPDENASPVKKSPAKKRKASNVGQEGATSFTSSKKPAAKGNLQSQNTLQRAAGPTIDAVNPSEHQLDQGMSSEPYFQHNRLGLGNAKEDYPELPSYGQGQLSAVGQDSKSIGSMPVVSVASPDE